MEAATRAAGPVSHRTDRLARLCEPPAGHRLYAVLDGASIGDLPARLLASGAEHVCLYRGELIPELAAAAPYLVRLDTHARLRNTILDHWSEHWGVLLVSRAELRVLRNHFRRLLLVWGPQQKAMYLRYYDPRVLAMLAPVFEPEQVRKLFGPVESFWGEGESTDLACCYQEKEGRIHVALTALA